MEFSALAQYFQKIEKITSRNAITEILAELFRHATSKEIDHICYLIQGRVAPLFDAIEFGIADKFIIRAISKAFESPIDEVVRVFKRTGDLGLTAESCYHVSLHGSKTGRVTVADVYHKLRELATTGGEGSQEKKIEILAELLCRVDSLSARFLVRMVLDKLRLGFSEMTILDGLSWMIAGDKSLRPKLEDAYNVRADIGYIAKILKEKGKGLSEVHACVGVPILAALCQRLPSADDMIQKMGEVAVEPKYDGSRVQIHMRKVKDEKCEVKSFSRNMENTTAMFPELVEAMDEIHANEVILDSEAVGINPKTGAFVSFQETMTRKRKHNIEEARASVPLKFVIFDLLYKDGKELYRMPLSDRRNEMEQTIQPGKYFMLSPYIVTHDPEELRRYHDTQLNRGLEGVVVKRWNSTYEPGRRGFSWVKFKEEEGKTGKLTDTIDAVIMGYSRGQGKRSGFGIGMFLVGVRKEDTFVTVTKIGTGVTDELWKKLHHSLESIQVSKQPKEYAEVNKAYIPDVWVTPKIVVEIAGDDLTKSPTHGAGVAVRFPRLVRIRNDKSPRQATEVNEIMRMFSNQSNLKPETGGNSV